MLAVAFDGCRTRKASMQIVRHAQYIKDRKRRGRWLALLGFVLLSGSLLIAWYPEFLIFAYVAMLAGFVMFNIGMQAIGKWTRNPRNDQILDHRMKGLSDRYTIIHYPKVENKIVEHLLVYPGGVLVMTARELDGKISQVRQSWRKIGGMFRRLFSFSGPQLGNPSFDTENSIKRVEAFLAQNQLEADVLGSVVFLNPKADVEVSEPDFPVLHGEEMEEFVRDLPADQTLSEAERARIVELLSEGEKVEIPVVEQASRRPRPVRRVASPKAKAKTKASA
jgi:hypothetical protein